MLQHSRRRSLFSQGLNWDGWKSGRRTEDRKGSSSSTSTSNSTWWHEWTGLQVVDMLASIWVGLGWVLWELSVVHVGSPLAPLALSRGRARYFKEHNDEPWTPCRGWWWVWQSVCVPQALVMPSIGVVLLYLLNSGSKLFGVYIYNKACRTNQDSSMYGVQVRLYRKVFKNHISWWL